MLRFRDNLPAAADSLAQAADNKLFTERDPAVIRGVFEAERYYSRIDKICLMDPGEAFYDNSLHTEIKRHERGVLA